MIAYKFLAAGAVGPFTSFAWPPPASAVAGPWVEAPDGRPEHGIHACRARDLAFWLDAELWRAELADPVADGRRQVIARRGRLVERISRWNDGAASRFAEECVWRARDRAVTALRAGSPRAAEALGRPSALADLHTVAGGLGSTRDLAGALGGYLAESIDFLEAGDPACAAYICARSAVAAAGGNEDAFGEEREQQGLMLARQLGLGA